MLKPVAVPATEDPFAWQRLRAYLVAREMESQGVPPHLAAEQADAQLVNAWRAKFPGEDLPLDLMAPSASREGLPGKIKAGEALTWAIVAAPTPDNEYLTGEEIARLTASYDPDFRRAPIVLPNGSGPVHAVGEWAPWVPGTVEALAHDGLHLWALIEDRMGAIGFQVDFAGIRERSIRWWPELTDLDPPRPYLRHVAMVSAEPPGVPSMPGLDQYFLGERTGGEKSLTARDAILNDFPTREEIMAEKDVKADAAPKPNDGKDAALTAETKDNATDDVTPDEGVDIAALVTAEVSKALAAAKTDTKELADQIGAAVAPSIAAAIKPITEQAVATGEQVKALAAELAALKDAGATSAATVRKQRVIEALDRAVSEGRLTAGHRELEESLLLDSRLTSDEVAARLDKIATLPQTINPAITAELSYADGDGTEKRVPARLLPPPNYAADPADLERVSRALSRAGDDPDPTRAYEARRRAIYAEYGAH